MGDRRREACCAHFFLRAGRIDWRPLDGSAFLRCALSESFQEVGLKALMVGSPESKDYLSFPSPRFCRFHSGIRSSAPAEQGLHGKRDRSSFHEPSGAALGKTICRKHDLLLFATSRGYSTVTLLARLRG
jgi:hypothetical protein